MIGAANGCGTAGIQLARYMNASDVVGVSSDDNWGMVLRQGATGVYPPNDFADRCASTVYDNERFDVVYDCASGSKSGEYYKKSAVTCLREADAKAGRKHGQYVAINGPTSMWVRQYTIGQKKNEHLFVSKHNTKDINLLPSVFVGRNNTKDLNLLSQLVDDGWAGGTKRLDPVVMKVLPLTSQAEVVRACVGSGFDR